MPETKRMSTKEVPFMGIPKKKSLTKGIPEAHAEDADIKTSEPTFFFSPDPSTKPASSFSFVIFDKTLRPKLAGPCLVGNFRGPWSLHRTFIPYESD